jgi:hypothetical protein
MELFELFGDWINELVRKVREVELGRPENAFHSPQIVRETQKLFCVCFQGRQKQFKLLPGNPLEGGNAENARKRKKLGDRVDRALKATPVEESDDNAQAGDNVVLAGEI